MASSVIEVEPGPVGAFFGALPEHPVTASVAVRELCLGKSLLFEDGGTHQLKGFAEPTQVYEVVLA
jgi:class 3 adenylate cyclase